MVVVEHRIPRALPAALSLGLHAGAAALIVACAMHPARPPERPDAAITVDMVSMAVAPGAEVQPSAVQAKAEVPSAIQDLRPAAPDEQQRVEQPAQAPVLLAEAAATESASTAEVPALPADSALRDDPLPSTTSSQAAPGDQASTPAEDVASSAGPSAPNAAPADLAEVQASQDTFDTASGTLTATAAPSHDVEAAQIDAAAPAASALVRDGSSALRESAAASENATVAGPVPQLEALPTALAAPDLPPLSSSAVPAGSAPAVPASQPVQTPAAELTPAGNPSMVAPDPAARQIASALSGLDEAGTSTVPAAPTVMEAPVASSTAIEVEPDQPHPSVPTQTARLETGPSVAAMEAFVDRYDGGACFYASVEHATVNGAAIDVLSDTNAKFQALDDAFVTRFGLDPNVLGQHVTSQQCPAVDLLRKGRPGDVRLQVDRNRLNRGDTLKGTVETALDTTLSLYLVDEGGGFQDVTQYTRREGSHMAFRIPMDRPGQGGPRPQLLIAAVDGEGQQRARLTLDGSSDPSRLTMAGKLVLVGDAAAH